LVEKVVIKLHIGDVDR